MKQENAAHEEICVFEAKYKGLFGDSIVSIAANNYAQAEMIFRQHIPSCPIISITKGNRLLFEVQSSDSLKVLEDYINKNNP